MRSLENLLIPGSTELPDCRCGEQMLLSQTVRAGKDAEIKVFRCDGCGHEMRLTVWTDPTICLGPNEHALSS